MGLYSGKTYISKRNVSFLSFLIYSFSTNFLGTYYMPGAVVDPQDRGLEPGTHHQAMEINKETTPKDRPRWRKQQRCGREAKGVRGFPLQGDEGKGWHIRWRGTGLHSCHPTLKHIATPCSYHPCANQQHGCGYVCLAPLGMALDWHASGTGRGPIAELI